MNEVIQHKGKEHPVVCGFYRVGKSFLAKNYPNFFDLETHFFEKDLNLLLRIIERYQKTYHYKITIAVTKENITLLLKNNINFIVVIPDINSYEEYVKRFKQRNSSKNFIKRMIQGEWEKTLKEVLEIDCPKIILKKGEHLHDVIGDIYGE